MERMHLIAVAIYMYSLVPIKYFANSGRDLDLPWQMETKYWDFLEHWHHSPSRSQTFQKKYSNQTLTPTIFASFQMSVNRYSPSHKRRQYPEPKYNFDFDFRQLALKSQHPMQVNPMSHWIQMENVSKSFRLGLSNLFWWTSQCDSIQASTVTKYRLS